MAGFGGKKKGPSNKNYKVDQKRIKNSKSVENNRSTERLENEIIDLPVYCSNPDKEREIDLFLVHAMIQSNRGRIKPYFIGNYSSKSFDMQIKSSSMSLQPKDLVEDNSDSVMNLSRK